VKTCARDGTPPRALPSSGGDSARLTLKRVQATVQRDLMVLGTVDRGAVVE
jgi:hypothetical protein